MSKKTKMDLLRKNWTVMSNFVHWCSGSCILQNGFLKRIGILAVFIIVIIFTFGATY